MQVHDLARHLQRSRPRGRGDHPHPRPRGDRRRPGAPHRRAAAALRRPLHPKAFRLVAELLERERVDVAHFHGGIVSPARLPRGPGGPAGPASRPSSPSTACGATPRRSFAALDRVGRLDGVADRALGGQRRRRRAAAPHRRARPSGAGAPQRDRQPGLGGRARRARPRRGRAGLGDAAGAPQAAPAAAQDDLAGPRAAPGDVRLRVVVIGEGPERPQLEKYVRTHGLGRGRRPGRSPQPRRDPRRCSPGPTSSWPRPTSSRSASPPSRPARGAAGGGQGPHRDPGVRGARSGGAARPSPTPTWSSSCCASSGTASCACCITKNNREVPSPVDWSAVVARNVDAYRTARRILDERSA